MKRLLSLLLISSFACAMDALKQEQKEVNFFVSQQLNLKKHEDCSLEEAIQQLNLIVSSLQFGIDENHCLNQDEIKTKEKIAGLYDLPILRDAFDQVISKLLQYDGQVKRFTDLLVQTLKTSSNKEEIKKINILNPAIKKYIYHHLLDTLRNLFEQSEYKIKGIQPYFPYKHYYIDYQSKQNKPPQSRRPRLWNNSIVIDGPSPQIEIKDPKPIKGFVPIDETNFILFFTEDTIKFCDIFAKKNVFSLHLNKIVDLDPIIKKYSDIKIHTISNKQVFNFLYTIRNDIDWSRL